MALADLKSLMLLLSERPRLAILDAVARSPGIDTEGIALSLSQPMYQIEPHLDALHEGEVEAEPNGEFLHFKVRVQGGDFLEARFHSADARDD